MMNSWYFGTFVVFVTTMLLSHIVYGVSFNPKTAQGFQPFNIDHKQLQKWNDRYQKRFGFGYPSSYNGFDTDSRTLISLGQLLQRMPAEKRMVNYGKSPFSSFDSYRNAYQNWQNVFSGMKRFKPAKEN